ncbi:unnamed protein product [Effrenium voratum]|nr:unnamed protein product [Effrenium voratum]
MKLCEKFPNFCEFGRYCHNAHGQDELQVRAPGPRLSAQPEAEQVDYPQPEAGERQKTLLCRFAAMGTCKHGDDCKFAHGEHEPERPIDWEEKPKSRFCSHFRERRFCQFGRYCVFAHAEEELQAGVVCLPTVSSCRCGANKVKDHERHRERHRGLSKKVVHVCVPAA